MTHDEIMNSMMVKDDQSGQTLLAPLRPSSDPAQIKVAFGPRVTVLPELESVLGAAFLMYHQLTGQYGLMAGMIADIQAAGMETDGPLVEFLEKAQGAILDVQRVAQLGLVTAFSMPGTPK